MTNTGKLWYEVLNAGECDSPALLIYPGRVQENIDILLEKVDPVNLRPHVKTNKTGEVCQMMIRSGISKFKAATIAETEMLALVQAPDVLLAYPATAPKIKRLIALIQKYPRTHFSFLVDNAESLPVISGLFSSAGLSASVYMDLNLGMNRTGIRTENAMDLFIRQNLFLS